ncbi:Tigger transposable element-derived protein 6 [Dictyocoela muelleri]|nr:Tigger transposable element-derived protein 6 [Dictyocoela muelleri]
MNKINNLMRKQNRKILVILDNFSGHNINNFSNITFEYLPPNTSSILQPLDQGIIYVLKQKYKKRMANYCYTAFKDLRYDSQTAIKNLNLCMVFNWANSIWNEISVKTIRNCWRKSGLLVENNEKNCLFNNDIENKKNINSVENYEFWENYDNSIKITKIFSL